MLARNKDVLGAINAIASLERNFNKWYKYPILFLNNEPWDDAFKMAMANITPGAVTFEVVPQHMWEFASSMDEEAARQSIKEQGERGIVHAGEESYHHMCRFYSGFFFNHPALQKYRWFWRVEPDASFTCAVTYDPFLAMQIHGKRYGYVMALWEVGRTAPSLFREVSKFKSMWMDEMRKKNGFWEATGFWDAMVDASWGPWPFRKMMRWLPSRNDEGDAWNFCHYWSNLEIADLDFFRGEEYRSFFNYLDHTGGFYFGRYGDAPIHSLAAALFLKPSEIHRFSDFGYDHSGRIQPSNAFAKQIPEVDLGIENWAQEEIDGEGCRCQNLHAERSSVPDTCLKILGEAI